MKPICLNTAAINDLEWTPHSSQGRTGASIHPLLQDEKNGQKVSLVRFHPNSSAQPHRHLGHESILVLSGAYSDEFGSYQSGDLVVYPPGSEHSWQSESGALLYVVWGGPTKSVLQESVEQV